MAPRPSFRERRYLDQLAAERRARENAPPPLPIPPPIAVGYCVECGVPPGIDLPAPMVHVDRPWCRERHHARVAPEVRPGP